MAVSIEQMEVEVREAPVSPAAGTSGAHPPQKVDLRLAFELLHEREERLCAD